MDDQKITSYKKTVKLFANKEVVKTAFWKVRSLCNKEESQKVQHLLTVNNIHTAKVSA
jgi:hypothetical protein